MATFSILKRGYFLDEEPFFGTFLGISPHHHTTPNHSHFPHILPSFFIPFSLRSPFFIPPPYTSANLPSPAPIGHFRHFQPFKFPLKIPSHFYREFSHIFTHFSNDFPAIQKLIKCLQFIHIAVISL